MGAIDNVTLHKLCVELDDRDAAYSVAAVLGEALHPPPQAVTVFEQPTSWLVEAYLSGALPTTEDVANRLVEDLGIAPPRCSLEEVPDLNWVAISQAALPPVQAGRFTIYGRHDRHRVANGPNSILIDAGEAFGTAHHATTYGCLMAIDRVTRRRRFDRVLDLGTGSGVLAVALHRACPWANVLATDIDRRSVEVAQENAALNHCLLGESPGRLQFAVGSGLGLAALRRATPFSLVVANILAGPLINMAKDVSSSVARRGHLVLSGILSEQSASVLAAYHAVEFILVRHERIEGWSTLTLRKR